MKKYTTHNIDETTFLVLKGFRPTVKEVGTSSAKFTFLITKSFEYYRKMFWTRGGLIDVHRWMATRQALKNETNSRRKVDVANKPEEKSAIDPTGLVPGQTYWFINGGNANLAYYGKAPIHLLRFQEGNFFFTKEDALAAIRDKVILK